MRRTGRWQAIHRQAQGLTALGVFETLSTVVRDGKQGYLNDIPRVWTHAHKVCTRYQGLGPLAKLLEFAEASTMGVQRTVGYTF